MSNSTDKPAFMVLLTVEQVVSKLAELRADRATWGRLEAKWGRIETLDNEIDSYEYLRGNDPYVATNE